MKRATHESRLLDYLEKYGRITSLEAVEKLGNTRISATVFNLRNKGYDITTEIEKGKNRYGDKVEYGVYKLIGGIK